MAKTKSKGSKRGKPKSAKKKGSAGGGGFKPKGGGMNNNFNNVGSSAPQNPFEIRINKRKHDNLGKLGRNERGVPGISRSRAIEKRKSTLLQEYKVRNKTNVLVDRRIGERRGMMMSEEDKMIKRSAAEKARQFKKKSIFNLQESDDLLLTHRGKPLVDIDRYEDPRDESDSEEERLAADFVTDAHFGGFMKVKEPVDDPEELDDEGKPKSHKQLIQELIAESKRKKYEKAKEADENYEIVCKLDDDFKNPDIRNLLLMTGKGTKLPQERDEPTVTEEKSAEEKKAEDYDKLVRTLQFEAKTGRAADRLKTEAELEQEEKEKLEQLERDRLRRMQMTTDDGVMQHRSADDLDDGFTVDNDFAPAEEEVNEEDDEQDEEEDEVDDEEADSDASDSYSDMGSDEDETEDRSVCVSKGDKDEDGEVARDKEGPSECQKEPFSDIPFVIQIPQKYKEFEAMLKRHKAHYRSSSSKSSLEALNLILTRAIKYNKASDRSKLPQLFNYIVRYVLETTEKTKKLSEKILKLLQLIMPHLHTLLVLNPNGCVEQVEGGEIFDDFYPVEQDIPVHKLLYFSMCTQLFCVTDFHHKVLSPMKARLLEILSNTKAVNIRIVVKLLFIVRIMFRLSEESGRYAPEVINFLLSIIQCFAGSSTRWAGFAIPTIRHAKSFLYVEVEPEQSSGTTEVDQELGTFLSNEDETTTLTVSQKLGVLNVTLMYLKKFMAVYAKFPSSVEIFHNFKKPLGDLQTRTSLPKSILERISESLELISKLRQRKKEMLVIQVSDRPKPLKLYEPLIEEGFDGIRKKKAPKGKQEMARLAHKVKQETKSAVREIRKDTAFLAKQQLREQLEKDSERKRKVKEILGQLANQEGEYKKIKRGKT